MTAWEPHLSWRERNEDLLVLFAGAPAVYGFAAGAAMLLAPMMPASNVVDPRAEDKVVMDVARGVATSIAQHSRTTGMVATVGAPERPEGEFDVAALRYTVSDPVTIHATQGCQFVTVDVTGRGKAVLTLDGKDGQGVVGVGQMPRVQLLRGEEDPCAPQPQSDSQPSTQGTSPASS